MIILKFILPLLVAGIVSGKTANLKQGGSACYPQPNYCLNGGTCYTQYTAQPITTTTQTTTPCETPTTTTTTIAPTTTQYIIVTQPVCGCQPQYVGDRCEVPVTTAQTTVSVQPECVDPVVTPQPSRCNTINCQNGGTCREIAMAPFVICICPPSYTGFNCESLLTTQSTTTAPMITYPTQTQAPVTQPPVQPSCVTPLTTQASNRCMNFNCKNGGTCREIAVAPYKICICPPSFTGNNCESMLTTPQITTKTTYPTTAQTTTPCVPVSNSCSTISCMNGGTCREISTASVGICVCTPSFTGSRCETPLVNPTQYPTAAPTNAPSRCKSVQCQNGGTCRDTDVAPYVICVCPSKFTGPRCETLLTATQQPIYTTQSITYPPTTIATDMTNLCLVYASRNMDLCQNSGQCVYISPGRVACVCPSNFVGQYCETPVYNKCTASSGSYQQTHCHREYGTCQLDGSCLCKEGWCGVSCDQKVVPVTQAPSKCSTVQCLNGGSCIEVSIEPFAICKCQPTYTGNRCETIVPTSSQTTLDVTNSVTTLGPYGMPSSVTTSANKTECTAFTISLLNEGAFTARFRVQYKVDDVYQTIRISETLPFVGNRAFITIPYYATDIAVSLEKLGGSWAGIHRDTGINNINYCSKCYKVWGDVVGAKWDYINC